MHIKKKQLITTVNFIKAVMASAESWTKVNVVERNFNNIKNADQNKNMGRCIKEAVNNKGTTKREETCLLGQQEQKRELYARDKTGRWEFWNAKIYLIERVIKSYVSLRYEATQHDDGNN